MVAAIKFRERAGSGCVSFRRLCSGRLQNALLLEGQRAHAHPSAEPVRATPRIPKSGVSLPGVPTAGPWSKAVSPPRSCGETGVNYYR